MDSGHLDNQRRERKQNVQYNNKKVRITTLYDKTIYGATQLMKSGKIDAKNVMFQVGSNDLETKKPDDIMDELHKLIQTTKEVLPNSSITLGQIIPRFYRERRMSTEFEQKRLILNNLIIEYCKEVDISCVEYVNMNNVDYIDGIHLNSYGVGILVRCLKKVLSPKLGVKIHETEQGRGHFEKCNINYHGNRGDFSERENIPRYTYNKTQENPYYGHSQRSNMNSWETPVFRRNEKFEHFRERPMFNLGNRSDINLGSRSDMNQGDYVVQDRKDWTNGNKGRVNQNENILPLLEFMIKQMRRE